MKKFLLLFITIFMCLSCECIKDIHTKTFPLKSLQQNQIVKHHKGSPAKGWFVLGIGSYSGGVENYSEYFNVYQGFAKTGLGYKKIYFPERCTEIIEGAEENKIIVVLKLTKQLDVYLGSYSISKFLYFLKNNDFLFLCEGYNELLKNDESKYTDLKIYVYIKDNLIIEEFKELY